jgi:hypothetical protein
MGKGVGVIFPRQHSTYMVESLVVAAPSKRNRFDLLIPTPWFVRLFHDCEFDGPILGRGVVEEEVAAEFEGRAKRPGVGGQSAGQFCWSLRTSDAPVPIRMEHGVALLLVRGHANAGESAELAGFDFIKLATEALSAIRCVHLPEESERVGTFAESESSVAHPPGWKDLKKVIVGFHGHLAHAAEQSRTGDHPVPPFLGRQWDDYALLQLGNEFI